MELTIITSSETEIYVGRTTVEYVIKYLKERQSLWNKFIKTTKYDENCGKVSNYVFIRWLESNIEDKELFTALSLFVKEVGDNKNDKPIETLTSFVNKNSMLFVF